jgi:hypothetical protein
MPPSRDEQQYRSKLASQYADLEEAWDAKRRKRELKPEQVDLKIANEIERLRSQAVAPTVEEADPERVRQDAERLREERRADNLRRMRTGSVLVQRQPDGTTVFKDDKQVRETVRSSVTGS